MPAVRVVARRSLALTAAKPSTPAITARSGELTIATAAPILAPIVERPARRAALGPPRTHTAHTRISRGRASDIKIGGEVLYSDSTQYASGGHESEAQPSGSLAETDASPKQGAVKARIHWPPCLPDARTAQDAGGQAGNPAAAFWPSATPGSGRGGARAVGRHRWTGVTRRARPVTKRCRWLAPYAKVIDDRCEQIDPAWPLGAVLSDFGEVGG